MKPEEHIPLMVLEDPRDLATNAATDALLIRELPPVEAPEHARLAAAGFEAPAELFLQLIPKACFGPQRLPAVDRARTC